MSPFVNTQEENLSKFEPELALTHIERAHLVNVASTEGFHILNRIMRSQVDTFVMAQTNADPVNEAEVLSAHRMAKAAAQFYQMFTDRINEEMLQYSHAPKAGEKPVDVTEGLLDLGDLEEMTEDLPDILGGKINANERG
jgi:hypothetical protein